jgi:hypothetical protein
VLFYSNKTFQCLITIKQHKTIRRATRADAHAMCMAILADFHGQRISGVATRADACATCMAILSRIFINDK